MRFPFSSLKLHFLTFICSIIFFNHKALTQKTRDYSTQLSKKRVAEQKIEKISKLYQNGQFDRSNQLTLNQLKDLGNHGDFTLQFECYNFLAANYTRCFKDDSAIIAFEKANELLKKKPQLVKEIPDYVVSHWINQGAFYLDKSNLKQATLSFLNGLQDCKGKKMLKYKVILLNCLANIYDITNKSEKAHSIYSFILKQKIVFDEQRVYILSSKGWNEIKRRRYTDAHNTFKQALKNYLFLISKNKIEPDNELITKFYSQLGLSSYLTKNLIKSNYFLDKGIGIQIQENNTKGVYLAQSFHQKARNAEKLGNIIEAISWLQKGIIAAVIDFNKFDIFKNPTLSSTILGENTLFKLLAFKAKLLYQIYKQNDQYSYLQASAKTFQLAVLLAENYRESIDSQEDKIFFTQNNTAIFDEALNVVYTWYSQKPNTEKATVFLSIVESRKSVAYNDFIKSEQLQIPSKYALERQKKLLISSEIAQLKQTLLQNKKNEDSLKTKLRQLEIDLSSVKNKLNVVFPLQSSNNINSLSIQELSAQLSPNTTFLSYDLSGDNYLYILLVSRGSWLIQRISIPKKSLNETLNILLPKLYKNPALMAYTGSKESILLYELLIKPVEKFIQSTERLVVCRDGALNNIPFEVLEEGRVKNDYLLKKFAITYTLSAIDYLQKQQSIINYQSKTLTICPFMSNCRLPDGRLLRSLSIPNLNRQDPDILLGQDATKQHWLTKVNKYNRLNLITHSTMDLEEPANSYLYFYPNSITEGYKLGFYEILSMPLQQQQLVIIASCNSAKGTLQKHEGTISLAYAFMRAGAGAVVGASWESHNRACSIVTEKFQEYLDNGLPKDVALQKAKLAFMESINGRDLDHPFYWANLTLIGDNKALSSEQKPIIGYLFFILTVIGIALSIISNLPKKFATIF